MQPSGTPGAIEIKAAWRIIVAEKGDDPSRYFTMPAMLQVSGDLVKGGEPICDAVTLGLVGMHIIQKTPPQGDLLAQWIWASFEHIDNAPLAKRACDPTGAIKCPNLNRTSCGSAAWSASTRYSYFDPHTATLATNLAPVPSRGRAPAFLWSAEQPYAADYRWVTPEAITPQAVRCWKIYSLTQSLNAAWQKQLSQANSIFANYMLIGTQWGANVEPPIYLPANAVPGVLSNITLETYIQNLTGEVNQQGPGSCVGCHSAATLAVDLDRKPKPSADFSFLPALAEPNLIRNIGRKSQ